MGGGAHPCPVPPGEGPSPAQSPRPPGSPVGWGVEKHLCRWPGWAMGSQEAPLPTLHPGAGGTPAEGGSEERRLRSPESAEGHTGHRRTWQPLSPTAAATSDTPAPAQMNIKPPTEACLPLFLLPHAHHMSCCRQALQAVCRRVGKTVWRSKASIRPRLRCGTAFGITRQGT